MKSKSCKELDTEKKPHRNGSDNGTGDSGQWTDSSESETHNDSAKAKAKNNKNVIKNQNKSDNHSCIEDQTMRNEDELIYIPDIRPPTGFVHLKNEQMSNHQFTKYEMAKNKSQGKLQRHSSENSDISKPTIVNVYHKFQNDNLSMADCEDSESILNWQYPSIMNNESKSGILPGNKKLSSSMSIINDDLAFDFREEQPNSLTSSSQFMLKTKKNCPLFYKYDLDDTFNLRFEKHKSIDKPVKNFASALQSYFFSGTTSLRKLNKSNSTNKIPDKHDSIKSFPIPRSYKNKFILKGHGNCGLYSGAGNNNSVDNLDQNQLYHSNDMKSWI